LTSRLELPVGSLSAAISVKVEGTVNDPSCLVCDNGSVYLKDYWVEAKVTIEDDFSFPREAGRSFVSSISGYHCDDAAALQEDYKYQPFTSTIACTDKFSPIAP
jgi:hypothetical protein